MIDLQTEEIRIIEDEILRVYECRDFYDYKKSGSLLEVRKKLINKRVLQHQEEILPDIIAFNDALNNTLRELQARARDVYNTLKANEQFGDIDITAQCYLGDYPKNHPVQGDDREDFWFAIRDTAWNPANTSEFTFHKCDLFDSFESIRGLDCPPDNWNEGLDRELTKDLHLTMPFHFLFAHSNFAITDFIYVREFITEINVEIEKRKQF